MLRKRSASISSRVGEGKRRKGASVRFVEEHESFTPIEEEALAEDPPTKDVEPAVPTSRKRIITKSDFLLDTRDRTIDFLNRFIERAKDNTSGFDDIANRVVIDVRELNETSFLKINEYYFRKWLEPLLKDAGWKARWYTAGEDGSVAETILLE